MSRDQVVDELETAGERVNVAAYGVKRAGRYGDDLSGRTVALCKALEAVAEALDRLEAAQRDVVAQLRETGTSWSTIGDVLGVSKQAAAQRFGERRPVVVETGPTLLDELEA